MPSHLKLEELVQPTRVHRRIYLEQEIFDLEMERIFESNWVFIGHESEVASPGDFKTVPLGTQPAIMTRDENGDIHVLMNRCMHRGSTVCQEERGNVQRLPMLVPRLDVQHEGRADRSSLCQWLWKRNSTAQVRSHQSGARREVSWAGFREPEADVDRLEYYLVAQNTTSICSCDLSPEGELEARAGIHKYGYDGNWKFQMENGVDGYHPNFVHQAFFEAQGRALGRKVMQLFASMRSARARTSAMVIRFSTCRRSAPQDPRPSSNILRGATSRAQSARPIVPRC